MKELEEILDNQDLEPKIGLTQWQKEQILTALHEAYRLGYTEGRNKTAEVLDKNFFVHNFAIDFVKSCTELNLRE